MDATQTLTTTLSSGAILTVLGWLGKDWLWKVLFEKFILRESKRIELELQEKSQAAIEKLKNDLELRAIAFSRLHEKRASVIAKMNSLLTETLWAAESALSVVQWAGEPSEREKLDAAGKKLTELFRYFDKHRVYLPVPLCEALESLIREVRRHVIGYGVYLTSSEETLPEHARKAKHKVLMDGYKYLKNNIPKIRQQLENEFRALLGPSSYANRDAHP